MRRKIAVISEHASPLADLGGVDGGGQNVYVAHVVQNLARMGYEVDVFTRCDDRTQPDIYHWLDGVRIIHVPAGPPEFVRKEDLLDYMPVFTEYTIDFFEREKKPYDLVHANFWMSGLVAADVKAAVGTPFVITFHALDRIRREFQGNDDRFPTQRFEIEQRVAREADGIIAECPQDKHDLVHFYDADPSKIEEIPCGFDPQELWPINKNIARMHIGVPESEWIVLQLGRMVPRKGVDTAIRGFADMVRKHNVPARMVVVGGASRLPDPAITPEIGRLLKIAEEEGVLERVLFAGSRGRQELKYYFSAADVFISTPWYEPFGITPVEAMACGTPVIGASVGGIKYTVVDGETGFLVPPNDPQAVSEKMLDLYQHPQMLERFGRQALTRVNEMFTWSSVTSRIASFYEEILTEKHPVVLNTMRGEPEEEATAEQFSVIQHGFEEAISALQRSKQTLETSILDAAKLLIDCLSSGGKIMVCGNGGSAADAQHFSAELVGQFISKNRRGLASLALTSDSTLLTAWANDVSYDQVFARQVEALGQPGDLLLGISTSGQSRNVVEAFALAQQMGIKCLALLGGHGGDLESRADVAVLVPAWNTQRIQEVHILVLHILCQLIEKHIDGHPVGSALGIEQIPVRGSSGKLIPYSGVFSMDESGRGA